MTGSRNSVARNENYARRDGAGCRCRCIVRFAEFLRVSKRRCSSAPASTTLACARCCAPWWIGARALPRETDVRVVQPTEPAFTGFVFKIQANMDPNHRDRIAFLRVCSGRYSSGMKVKHRRTGKEMKLANAVTFMANERTRMDEAYAGDIIGVHNHGQLQIGDVLTRAKHLSLKESLTLHRSYSVARACAIR